jgi:multicomponent Na+:H+ antiporter subunit D
MAAAGSLSRFDREGIDRLIDGSAAGIVGGGDKVRLHVTGRVQHYIGGAVALLFIILSVILLM